MNLQFLSKDYPVEKSFFIISKFCLSWMGQFPRSSSSLKQNINSALHLIILFAGVISQFWYGFYYVKEDLQRGLDAICPAISCMVSFVKMALICWYGKDLSVVIMHLEKMLFNEKNEKRNRMVSNLSATATNLAFMVLASGVIANIFYGLRPIFTNIIRVMIGKEYLFDETPLRVMVPAISLTLPWYPLTYALISYMGNVTVFAFSGVDGIFISFCLYTTALLKLLQNDMEMSLKQRDSYTCWKELRLIIDRHNEVVDLVKNFTAIFKWIILSHFVTSSVVIGASIIETMLYPGYRALVYLTYTAAVSCELFIYCYGGSAVSEKSSGLGLSAYISNWQSYDLKVQKMILMIIIRSQKPLTMAVPFFTPSLETFTSVICISWYFWRQQVFRKGIYWIIRTAGSIIAVVKSVL